MTDTERTINVLMVDGEEDLLTLMARRLSKRGMDVATATSGVEALELASRRRFDVAVVDLKMPGMDGVEVMQRLREVQPFIQTIMFTGHGTTESALEAGKLDMGHARALVGRDNAAELANQAIAKKLSVREGEKLARAGEGGSRRRTARQPRDPGQDADITAVQNHLEEFLGLPVKIEADADPSSGSVTVRFRTLDQLDLICQRLTGGGI